MSKSLPPALQRIIDQRRGATDPTQPRKRKYGGKLCTDQLGILYDSMAERDRADELRAMLALGDIAWWSFGPRFVLVEAHYDSRGRRVPAVTYRPDYLVRDKFQRVWAEDTKGYATREFKMKQKLWAVKYPDVELRVIR